jgi:hypothetical protein
MIGNGNKAGFVKGFADIVRKLFAFGSTTVCVGVKIQTWNIYFCAHSCVMIKCKIIEINTDWYKAWKSLLAILFLYLADL